ncbi:MAG: hypothetical protein IJZ17_00225, partial [Muribaculaceae bacterium]|nr:hypothetical protein [Muribaculaceae bacterium]
RDKLSGKNIPFSLNRPQRRVLAVLESQRLAQKPLRLILLKARQWGGSTLILMYMAWIQCLLRRNWHSLICAHVKYTAAAIRGMYTKMLDSYPENYWVENCPPKFKPFERSSNTREITGRDCRVTVGSSENQEAIRGNDIAMAHLSECAFWSDSLMRNPESLIRAICGSIARVPLSLVVIESTANGVGNYFHSEWLRSCRGESDKEAVFVPWHEIEIYREPVDDYKTLWQSLDNYEIELWNQGCTLEQIQWYHNKRREYASLTAMQAEYPTNDVEAFTNSGNNVFDSSFVNRLRESCSDPVFVGELSAASTKGEGALQSLHLSADPKGCLKIWHMPAPPRPIWLHRYVVAVDIGGRCADSDYSVIAVIDRIGGHDHRPVIAAQWRGHIDHDILAWKAASLSMWYHEALLVIESNTLDTQSPIGEQGLYILAELNDVYPNLYCRHTFDSVTQQPTLRLGFHTNRATKSAIISHLIASVRDASYVESDILACDEMSVYEQRPNGSYAAKQGRHDDILMTRAMGLYVASTLDEPFT